jgi:hypothetical protein
VLQAGSGGGGGGFGHGHGHSPGLGLAPGTPPAIRVNDETRRLKEEISVLQNAVDSLQQEIRLLKDGAGGSGGNLQDCASPGRDQPPRYDEALGRVKIISERVDICAHTLGQIYAARTPSPISLTPPPPMTIPGLSGLHPHAPALSRQSSYSSAVSFDGTEFEHKVCPVLQMLRH